MYGATPTKLQPDGVHQALLVKESGHGKRRTTVWSFNNAVFDLVDDTGVAGHIFYKIYDFAEGLVGFEAMVVDLTLTRVAVDGDTAGLSTTWNGDIGIGTVTGAGAALTTTEQDLVPSTATPAAVAGVTTAKAINAIFTSGTAAGMPRTLDGTASAIDVWLNLLVDDADQDAGGHPVQVQIDGTITMHWLDAGDK